jgi:hypothetical protein
MKTQKYYISTLLFTFIASTQKINLDVFPVKKRKKYFDNSIIIWSGS